MSSPVSLGPLDAEGRPAPAEMHALLGLDTGGATTPA